MAKGRCPGECGFEDTTAKVEVHMRKCLDYAHAFRADPSGLPSPSAAYAAAHPAPAKAPKAPKPPIASDAPSADASVSPESGDSVMSGGAARTKRSRRPAPAPLAPAPDAPRVVVVEYWDTVPDLLTTMLADAAAHES